MIQADDPRYDRTFGEMPPPPISKRFFPILSPKPDMPVKAIITSDRPLACWTHYHNRETFPCTRSNDTCSLCRARLSPRWKAYLCGMVAITGKSAVIELTAGAVHSCPKIIDEKAKLRGWGIELFRGGRAVNAPVRCKLFEAPPSISKGFIPPPFDLKSSLLRMWGNPFAGVDLSTEEVIENAPPPDFLGSI